MKQAWDVFPYFMLYISTISFNVSFYFRGEMETQVNDIKNNIFHRETSHGTPWSLFSPHINWTFQEDYLHVAEYFFRSLESLTSSRYPPPLMDAFALVTKSHHCTPWIPTWIQSTQIYQVVLMPTLILSSYHSFHFNSVAYWSKYVNF
jgi:hypothetical protein